MNALIEKTLLCPYCGERITVLIDASALPQSYIEDCQVCCRPIHFEISENLEGECYVEVSAET